MKRRLAIAPALLTVLFFVLACSESSTETNPDTPAGDLPACAARAPAIEGTTYPPDAIPSGACTTEGERCAMTIGYACESGGIGRTDRAQCTCLSTNWSCALTVGGTSRCPSPPNDASASPD